MKDDKWILIRPSNDDDDLHLLISRRFFLFITRDGKKQVVSNEDSTVDIR